MSVVAVSGRQAEAHIFDENGNVVWGEDAGVRQAMETLNTLLDEKLVLLTQVLQPPMWDATVTMKSLRSMLALSGMSSWRRTCPKNPASGA